MIPLKTLLLTLLFVGNVFQQQKAAACNQLNIISVSNIDDHSADITWTPILAAIGYQILVDTTPVINPSKAIYLTTTSFDHDSLDCDVKYYVSVRTVCGVNDTSAWTRDSFTTVKCCNPPIPLTFYDITPSTAKVNFTPPNNASGYEFTVSSLPGPSQGGQFTTSTTVQMQGLTYGVLYYFCVKTRCNSGSMPQSAWYCDTIRIAIPCDSVTGIQKIFFANNDAAISWSPVPMASSYQYTITPISQTSGTPIVTNSTQIVAKGLSPDNIYNVCVRVVCSTGSVSPWVCDTMKVPLAVERLRESKHTKIYPNPVHNQLIVETDKAAKDARLEIINTMGRIVLAQVIKDRYLKVDISELPPGLYLIKYTNATGSETTTILKE